MKQLGMEIKGQDHATAAANLEGGIGDEKKANASANATSGKKSKGGSLLQRFKLNEVLISGSSQEEVEEVDGL